MEHKLSDAGLKMRCLRGAHQLTAPYHETVLSDLTEISANGHGDRSDIAHLFNHDLNDCDFLIIASDLETGKVKAVLGMMIPSLEGSNPIVSNSYPLNDVSDTERFLQLKVVYVAPASRGRGIMTRMIALALLRIACFGEVPKVIVARTASPVWFRKLRHLSRSFTDAVFFPDHDSPAIRMDSVRLAQQIARQIAPSLRFDSGSGTLRGGNMTDGAAPIRPAICDPQVKVLFGLHLQPADQLLVTLDLRAHSESTILENAKRVYRTRRPVYAIAPSGGPKAKRYLPGPIRQSR